MARGSFLEGDRVKLSSDAQNFSKRLGHQFSNPELLVEALTHSSFVTAQKRDNQRLEFLGDRVLGLVMAEALLEDDVKAREGTLAPRFNALVRKETCAEVAIELDVGAVLKMGRSEMISGGRRKLALLGDAMEAIIAAVYIDAGFDAARDVILKHWTKRITTVETDARDPKTALQEWAQARGFQPPKYVTVSREGPDHAPVFVIEAQMQNGETQQGKAGTKRQAEQLAAKELLTRLEKT